MAFSEAYALQVSLLIRVLPQVATEACFALKGGTAINLFHRDLPRLSVDIDLTYLPVSSRTASLTAIDAALKRIKERLSVALPSAKSLGVTYEGGVTKLRVRDGGAQVKIEVTPVLRGAVFEPVMREVTPAVQDAFGFAEAQLVSFADLYAGKIVAALDRQHPRDLFDVRMLLANEGIDDDLRRAFLVYLVSHGRPMSEVLAPRLKALGPEFARGFQGMTAEPVEIGALEEARDQLIAMVVGGMPEPHRQFLIGFERGEPDWAALGIVQAEQLPAVRWRRQNLDKLSEKDRARLVERLEAVLFGR